MGRHAEKLLDGLPLEIEGEPNPLFGDGDEMHANPSPRPTSKKGESKTPHFG